MDLKELKRMKELEKENSELKQMFPDMALESHTLKDLIKKSFSA
jgi:putative transposase|tara:strand:+ start:3233 stop:3364 length:132 start_codon:yes stop_codon:yes gene_type:complete